MWSSQGKKPKSQYPCARYCALCWPAQQQSHALSLFTLLFKLWETGWQSPNQKYPDSLIEAQGALVAGTHFCVVSGFIDTITQCSEKTYCKDIRDPSSIWIKQDDLTDNISIAGSKLSQGFSHAGFVAVGSKYYTCGGVSPHLVMLSRRHFPILFCQLILL